MHQKVNALESALAFIVQYGYGVVFLWVLAEQLGLPIPSFPVLLAVGAMGALDRTNLPFATAAAFLAALISDVAWFQLGRRHGTRILGRLCKISLEPDSCVRRTENFFGQHGLRSLLVAKFVPGLNTAAPPLAGAIRSSWRAFLLFDVTGILLWLSTFEGLGFLFHDQLQHVADIVETSGRWLAAAAVIAGLAAYVLQKFLRRRHFFQQLRMLRISPEELKVKMDSDSEVTVLDLRHPLDFLPNPFTIPGAIRIPMDELAAKMAEFPKNREMVVYCTCPNEATSAMTVLRLRQMCFHDVRPLSGGYFGWRDKGLPLHSVFDSFGDPNGDAAVLARDRRRTNSIATKA